MLLFGAAKGARPAATPAEHLLKKLAKKPSRPVTRPTPSANQTVQSCEEMFNAVLADTISLIQKYVPATERQAACDSWTAQIEHLQ